MLYQAWYRVGYSSQSPDQLWVGGLIFVITGVGNASKVYPGWRTIVRQPKPPILIIESNNPTLELYRRELSRNFRVLACAEEAAALELAQTPDLAAVVLEPAISNGQGWKLLGDLRQALHGIPIILCSTMDERKRGQEAGAADFLVKPVLPQVLVETLLRAIRLATKD